MGVKGLNTQNKSLLKFMRKKKSKHFQIHYLQHVFYFSLILPLLFLRCFKMQGVKLFFFSNSHLAPKFFKVVANSKKKMLAIFKDKKNLFFTLSAFWIDPPN